MKFLQRVKALFQQGIISETGNSVDVVKDKYSAYSVVHYPLSGKFYPKKNGRCLRVVGKTIMPGEDTEMDFMAESFVDEDSAWAFIDKAIEQMDKVNVRVLTRKET